MSEIKLLPQEVTGNSKFNGQLVMTCGFIATFGEMALLIAIITQKLITEERVNNSGADYLQAVTYDGIKFWVIDDGPVITFLLPEEY